MKFVKSLSLICLLSIFITPANAGEGMWIPLLLKSLNEADMQAMGMEITAEDIYSVNQSSLKDAIVRFGGGCTGEIISKDGLVLTNHHCGYGQIQRHSSLENDYLKDGFWAMNRDEELINPGLSVTFIVRIEDVTAKMLEGVSDDMDEESRSAKIKENGNKVKKEVTTDTHYNAEVKSFYYGNEYYLFVTEVFKDVRLVGAPPSSIGKYGKDTDNWVWPRHTGDFSLFRVYTGPNGLPAEYSPNNIPLKPKHFLPISLDGVQEKDFTMVYGFPGQTQEYLTADGVDMIMNIQDPIRIELRAKRLEIIDAAMMQDDQVRIQYASKQSGISNGYKKWKGEIRGLKRDNALEKKKEFEAEFTKRIEANPKWKEAYGGILAEFKKYYQELEPLMVGVQYFTEAGYSIEVVNAAARITRFIGNLSEDSSDAEKQEVIEKLERFGNNFFKNYSPDIDRKITATMLRSYQDDVPAELKPDVIKAISNEYNGDFEAYAKSLFDQSSLVDKNRYDEMVENFSVERIQEDPGFYLMAGLYQSYYQVSPKYYQVRDEIDRLNRTYMKALREVFPEKKFYPDANSTLRVSFGKVEGMKPRDGVTYKPFTTLDGVISKYKPGDYEFDLPQKLLDLHRNKDYGQYAQNGELHVCFIASNHTSGGNSGSPVINGKGHLIGLNFDRNWEGTMSDINYDIEQCRNISVDIRYVLFIIDKFAGARYLLEEMKLIDES